MISLFNLWYHRCNVKHDIMVQLYIWYHAVYGYSIYVHLTCTDSDSVMWPAIKVVSENEMVCRHHYILERVTWLPGVLGGQSRFGNQRELQVWLIQTRNQLGSIDSNSGDWSNTDSESMTETVYPAPGPLWTSLKHWHTGKSWCEFRCIFCA